MMNREAVRAWLRGTFPEFDLRFESDGCAVTAQPERADEAVLTLTDEDVVEVPKEGDPALSALDRLDRIHGGR